MKSHEYATKQAPSPLVRFRQPAPLGRARERARGRVLVRPSGTEPLVRVMVEAPDEAECEEVLSRLVAAARRELG